MMAGRVMLMVMVVIVVMSWMVFPVRAEHPSVLLVESTVFGNMILAPGKMISEDNDIYDTVNVTPPSICSCRTACWSSRRCVSAVVLETEDGANNTVQCHLSEKVPMDSTFTDNPNATYIFWQESVQSVMYEMLEDNLLYLVLPQASSLIAAKSDCEKIPGHRLALLKTDNHFQAVKKRMSGLDMTLRIDLLKFQNGDEVWGDGTPFSLSQIIETGETSMVSLYFVPVILNSNLNFQIYNFQDALYPLCQANPFGQDW
ncbi:uncharacterized protein LOC121868514 [Homarus americanus]|nr:uncharacterized protein LOC121868513 [Homarus americanus]XP_042225114.1 uncharacterized protein LOC121868514 [Homarus americanus]